MGYHTIITVINEHSGSTVTASYAIALAVSSKARLVLYSAHATNTSEAILHHTEHHLDHLFASAVERGISVTRISETGSISRLLPKRVLAEAADLVFYPLPPGEQYGAALQKQNVHLLMHSIKADLVITRIMNMARPHPHRILVPLGGIINDQEQRVHFLETLGRSFNAQITLFHRSSSGTSRIYDNIIHIRNELKRHHLTVLERSGTGQIAKAIALEAISHHNDLIVVGASERGLLRRLFWGNPVGDLMLHAPCNVLIFRAAPDAP